MSISARLTACRAISSIPEFGWGKYCADFTPPAGLLGPHSASLGMRFYTGSMFPKAYKNAIFVARHGSWNRSKKVAAMSSSSS